MTPQLIDLLLAGGELALRVAQSRGMEGEEIETYLETRIEYRKTLVPEATPEEKLLAAVFGDAEPDATTQDGDITVVGDELNDEPVVNLDDLVTVDPEEDIDNATDSDEG